MWMKLSPDPDDALRRYCQDLTALAQEGALEPIIGRDEEIRRTIEILSRMRKNNPVLIGDAGVGKTAIVEGIAQRIAARKVPEGLLNKRVLSLDMGRLIAGACYVGDSEERVAALLDGIERAAGQVILFVDELHTMIGAGAGENAPLDVANQLKPALARGQLRCIGATTLGEYRQHVEKDRALERRFQRVHVGEPSEEDTITILRGLKKRYEAHHGVRIQDAALVAAVRLSIRYLTDRFLPDKAIDLIDEASSRLKMETESLPAGIDETQRQIRQLQIELRATSPGRNKKARQRTKELTRKIAQLQGEKSTGSKLWRQQRKLVSKLKILREKEEELATNQEEAQRRGDLQNAAELLYGGLPEVRREIEQVRHALRESQQQGSFVREEVTDDDIAGVVSLSTGIPVSKMQGADADRLLGIENYLHQRVVGQEQAVGRVAETVRVARAATVPASVTETAYSLE
jgi:ATP-dependent Clp protease ATP-binding subunit ClpB